MPITEELIHLGNSARRLNRGSDQLNHLIQRIDQLLSQLNVGLDYVHLRPIDESTTVDHNGKRVIELSYVGYLRTQRNYHLAIKTVKVLESKLSLATQAPGEVTPLLAAPRRLRYAAVDVLPEVVSGLATQVDEMVNSLERRCETAQSLLHNLEQVNASIANAEDSGIRGKTLTPGEMHHARQVIVPGEAHADSSGQWRMPQQAAPAQPQPAAGRDERRTIAIGSDTLKNQR